ncbi:MAG: hypothetical protein HY318_19390 [Armatimonadetes bacterium]|nr:hypothetical protein [Armatimonadota bacterium]
MPVVFRLGGDGDERMRKRMKGMSNCKLSRSNLMAVVITVATILAHRAVCAPLTFDNAAALKGWTVSGDVGIDTEKDRGGVGGGALRLGPGGRAMWPLRKQDGTGKVELWIFEDGAIASNPKTYGASPMWGLMQADGHMAAVGPLYAPYLDGSNTYAISTLNPEKQKPWQEVQYLAIRRAPGWHKWTFDFDPDKGVRILYDDQDVKYFNWNQSKLEGFTSVVLFGDATDSKQILWVDDVDVALGPPARVKPVWPPPPPTPPADLTVLPQQAPWNPTPYSRWKNGPGKSDDYFPIAVWLQNPKNASRYKAAGINLYLALWQGPTAEQMQALRKANMPVICDLNDYAAAHLDDPLVVAWMQPDEPDNAQPFKDYWKEDMEKLKEAWPQIESLRDLGPNKPYRGYGPPIPPRWIVRDYEAMKAQDPTRPIFLGLGQGVAWEKWYGRGERTGKLEDYPEYIKGCDIVGFDIYPAAHDALDVKDALWHVARGVRRLREWCKDSKPVWVHLETGIIGVPTSQPTPQQVRAEVWMALIHGARGIDYFVHQFKPKFNEHALLDNPEMLATVTATNQQITKLARVLNSPTLDGAAIVTSTNPKTPVHAMVKRKDGATYVFAVAMYQEATRATFRIAGLKGKRTAEVLGENRTVPVKNGLFTDAFEGNGVHLYKITEAAR